MGLDVPQPGAVSRDKLDEDSSKCTRLFYVRGMPAVGDDPFAVAELSTARRVLVKEHEQLGSLVWRCRTP
jgi:hypothetical protein